MTQFKMEKTKEISEINSNNQKIVKNLQNKLAELTDLNTNLKVFLFF